MKKTVILSGRQVEYELLRKSVKNINLRIRADGSVAVSAPRMAPQGLIEDFLREKGQYILAALDRYAALAVAAPEYRDGERFMVLGRERTLRLAHGEKNTALLERDSILLTARDTRDLASLERTLDKLLRALCLETVEGLCAEAYALFEKRGVAYPEIKLRRMKSRWGSCASQKGVLTFSTGLIFPPLDCVEYVVYHEFTHFLHPDHSPAFYACLAEYIPDWKDRRRRLSDYAAYIK